MKIILRFVIKQYIYSIRKILKFCDIILKTNFNNNIEYCLFYYLERCISKKQNI